MAIFVGAVLSSFGSELFAVSLANLLGKFQKILTRKENKTGYFLRADRGKMVGEEGRKGISTTQAIFRWSLANVVI